MPGPRWALIMGRFLRIAVVNREHNGLMREKTGHQLTDLPIKPCEIGAPMLETALVQLFVQVINTCDIIRRVVHGVSLSLAGFSE